MKVFSFHLLKYIQILNMHKNKMKNHTIKVQPFLHFIFLLRNYIMSWYTACLFEHKQFVRVQIKSIIFLLHMHRGRHKSSPLKLSILIKRDFLELNLNVRSICKQISTHNLFLERKQISTHKLCPEARNWKLEWSFVENNLVNFPPNLNIHTYQ